jgi:molybdopterin-containing oxidoreductase family iron-sulfur binding subunit
MTQQKKPLDIQAVRQRLDAASSPEYWRSLEDLAGTPEFQALVQRELPGYVDGWIEGVDRRKFLALLGASLALAGLSGCYTRPRENIFPYVHQPPELVPGRPLFFATAMPQSGYGVGLLVESHEGRPTKIEGNPDHPASRMPVNRPPHTRYGPTNVQAQASVLTLWDPDRARSVTYRGDVSSWDAFSEVLEARLRGERPTGVNRHLRIRLLTETVTSPTLYQQIRTFLERFPQAKWHVYEPAGRDNARIAAKHAFGREVDTICHFDQADVILSLDADFLGSGPASVRYMRDFSSRRLNRAQGHNPRGMNRLYVVESMHTVTGVTADHRWPMKAGAVEGFARAVARELGIDMAEGSGLPRNVPPDWLRALVRDLRAHRGRGIVLAGDGQPPIVHALAHRINQELGNTDSTITHVEPVAFQPPAGRGMPQASAGTREGMGNGNESRLAAADDPLASLRELVHDLGPDQTRADVLIILGGNPVYTAPADLPLAERMARVPLRVHVSLYRDETSESCQWHIPETHFLESWSDLRAYDGTASIIQPLIAPLYGGRTPHELLGLLNGTAESTGYDVVRSYWENVFAVRRGFAADAAPYWRLAEQVAPFAGDFDSWWRQVLHDGVIQGTASARTHVRLGEGWSSAPGAGRGNNEGLEIVFHPDPGIGDGRFANNGWLQEWPRPITHLTWGNAAFISPATAVRLGFAGAGREERANGRVVTLRYQGRSLEAPLWVVPGHADDSITVFLGYGRERAGHVGTGVGFNAYTLRTAPALWFGMGLQLEGTGHREDLACTQLHQHMHGRDLIYSGTPRRGEEPRTPRQLGREEQEQRRPGDQPGWHGLSLYPNDFPHDEGNQWGMAIDLTLCTGCSACVVACQAENNIPVVGKDQVLRSREMHWLRVDTYYRGDPAEPARLQTFSQPVPCMHCVNAPCELVCPVEATSHSTDGLNEMTYNRCVGTRYCSNNCPYKVRRFNFLQFADIETESRRQQYNPEVTVRSRGVMEKCTYCVQRIRNAQIGAEREDRDLRDGEVQTACQAACPAGAITFGDINQRRQEGQFSRVKQLKDSPLNYSLLGELNTRPRTTYLAALKNPNPSITPPERATE